MASNTGVSDIFNEGELTINNSYISGNIGDSCIVNYGSATISNSQIDGNYATDSGGAIFNAWNLTISNSTIGGNTARFNGGAIYNNEQGNLTISNSTLYNNTAYDSGGAIFNQGQTTITNSTFSGNACADYGGAVNNYNGSISVTDCTISGNSGGTDGGGIYTQSYSYDSEMAVEISAAQSARASEAHPLGSPPTRSSLGESEEDSDEGVTLSGTIVAGNTGGDIDGSVAGTYNLIGDGSGDLSTDSSDHNILGSTGSPIDPGLDTLAYNGGQTETMALSSDSPAIDAGNSFDVNTDQRGFARMGGFNIGAYQNTFQIFNDTFLPTGTDTGEYDFNGIGVPQMFVTPQFDPAATTAEGYAKEYAADGEAENGYLCFDIESSSATNAELIQLVAWAKEVDPNLKVGFYNDLDGSSWYENIYDTSDPGALSDIQDADLALMGIQPDGSYNQADDVYRVSDFITYADYPSDADSWLDERISELAASDGQTYGASRVEYGVTIPQKPVYIFLSADYLLPDSDGESPMNPGDLQAILAQRALDSDGVILWGGKPEDYSYSSWFAGLSNFTTQTPSSVSAPSLRVDSGTMTINWTDSDSGVQGYEIYRRVDGQSVWAKVGYAPAGATTWSDQQVQADVTDPDLPTGDAYDYQVRAITGISNIFSDSNIVYDVSPARDGYANNLAVGWNDENGGTGNYTRASEEVEAVDAPGTNDGWLEYDNVDLSSGATSLNLNLVYFQDSPDLTINVYYGAPPGQSGSVLAGSLDLSSADYTTSRTEFTNLSYNDFGDVAISVAIPTATTSNIYIQFVSASGTPNQYLWLGNWEFVNS
jgi:predicted outer membrane repeat protein